MLWLAIVLFLALTISMLRGGRLVNLGDIELKGWWLLILAFGLQAATGWLGEDSDTAGLVMILLSFALLMALVGLNRSKPGMWIAGIGVLMNFTVIAINGGMPVLAGAAEVASGFTVASPDPTATFKHVPLDSSSRLTFFRGRGPVEDRWHRRSDQSWRHLPCSWPRRVPGKRATSAETMVQARRQGAAGVSDSTYRALDPPGVRTPRVSTSRLNEATTSGSNS